MNKLMLAGFDFVECVHFSRNSSSVFQHLQHREQPLRGVLRKRCFENMQQIYKRTSMPKCDFTLRHGCSPVNSLHIFRAPFTKKHLWEAASGTLDLQWNTSEYWNKWERLKPKDACNFIEKVHRQVLYR